MELLRDIDRINMLLADRPGWSAMLWLYSATFRRVAIRVYQLGSPQELYVVCVGAKSYSGPVDWHLQGLEVNAEPNTYPDEALYHLIDRASGFELTCDSGVFLAVGRPEEFGGSLDDFLPPEDAVRHSS